MDENMLKGSCVALVTPFHGKAIDYSALERLVEWHIGEGTHSLLAVGSTGEAFSLSRAEHVNSIDLIEKIPYRETREYVQRVFEDLAVYRKMANNRKKVSS